MLDFNNTLLECGLQDVISKRNPFTWSNRRYDSNLIEERLDRFLCTQNWKELFKGAKAYNVEACGSDHLPIMIDICKKCRLDTNYGRSRRFHYENFWGLYDDCKSVIAQVWKNNVEPYDYDLTAKFLKKIEESKLALKRWNIGKLGEGSNIIELFKRNFTL